MEDIVFKTSNAVKVRVLVLYAIILFASILLWIFSEKANYVFLIGWVPVMVILYLGCCEKYIFTDEALIIKKGEFYQYTWKTNIVPWNSITNVSSVRKGFRIDYEKSDGKKGFYIIINIKEWDRFQYLVEKQTSRYR